jgi:hypothetical protein
MTPDVFHWRGIRMTREEGQEWSGELSIADQCANGPTGETFTVAAVLRWDGQLYRAGVALTDEHRGTGCAESYSAALDAAREDAFAPVRRLNFLAARWDHISRHEETGSCA